MKRYTLQVTYCRPNSDVSHVGTQYTDAEGIESAARILAMWIKLLKQQGRTIKGFSVIERSI